LVIGINYLKGTLNMFILWTLWHKKEQSTILLTI